MKNTIYKIAALFLFTLPYGLALADSVQNATVEDISAFESHLGAQKSQPLARKAALAPQTHFRAAVSAESSKVKMMAAAKAFARKSTAVTSGANATSTTTAVSAGAGTGSGNAPVSYVKPTPKAAH